MEKDQDFGKTRELEEKVAGPREQIEESHRRPTAVAEVTAEDIAEVVSRATGIPVSPAHRGGA